MTSPLVSYREVDMFDDQLILSSANIGGGDTTNHTVDNRRKLPDLIS